MNASGPRRTKFFIGRAEPDLSVYDIFGVMAAGGTLIMPDHELKGDPAHWLDLLEEQQLSGTRPLL